MSFCEEVKLFTPVQVQIPATADSGWIRTVSPSFTVISEVCTLSSELTLMYGTMSFSEGRATEKKRCIYFPPPSGK
jgi:hypothetical protein